MPEEKRIRVNQRALVHKVLARYPENFAVFREIIQNADDAEATEVRIEFQTSDYAINPAGAMNGTTPDVNTELFKWVVRNNGTPFGDDDWKRVKKIGDGNPGEQKIGAFGVGFYSVFSVTDRPLVLSGGRSLSIFFGDDEYCRTTSTDLTLHSISEFDKDELYTLEDEYVCDGNGWTTIEMELKKDMRGPIPNPFDLARFLSATMTFMSHLKTTSVLLDGKELLKIEKSREEPRDVSIPSDMKCTNEEESMRISTVSVATQDIRVTIPNWVLDAGTKRSSAEWPVKDSLPNKSKKRKEFWGPSETSEAQEITPMSRTSSSAEQFHTSTASYAVYSANVTTDLSEDLREGLKAMTKKDPPPHFEFQMVYFSKEQHDARAKEEKSGPMGSVFRGAQGLFPKLDCNRDYMLSRVFIGQSTAQTTGIGGHLSGRFIPTVERGSIDLTNCHIEKWNKELLYIGGFLARLVYETEIKKIPSTSPMDGSTTGPAMPSPRDDALYVMRYFSFHKSTPDDKVSEILRKAFFDCSDNASFPILSSSGIRYTKDVRQPDKNLGSFMKRTPVLLPTEPGDPPNLIDVLPEKYKVPQYKFGDVVDDLKGRILQADEMTSLLRWWVDAYQEGLEFLNTQAELDGTELNETTAAANKEYMRMAADRLKRVAIWHTGDSKREVPLCDILKFVDSDVWLPWLSSSDPIPPDTIPLSFTRTLDKDKISEALDWHPMTVVDWLRHLTNPDVDLAHDICKDETYSNQVLRILGNIWGALPPDAKSEAKELMKEVPWISTNQGFRKANEAYFSQADIFGDLPVVTANVSDRLVVPVLTHFGVKLRLDFDELFEKPVQNALSAEKMIRYIWSDQIFRDRLEEVKTKDVFPCEKGEKYCTTDLYLPHDDIRKLGLPILDWPRTIDTDDDAMLTELGFLKHPPLEKIIEIAGSDNPDIRHAAFAYFSDKFDKLYEEEYDPLDHEGAFIPAVKDGVECVGAHKDVFDSDHSWAEIGFLKVHDSVDNRMKSRLKILKAPSTDRLIEIFEERAPKDHDTAAKWFAFFATNPGLTPDDIQQVAEFPIVPIEDQHGTRMVLPRECFLISKEYADDHHYRRIFTFVDFGEPGNKFLEHCGVRTKPDCSDIVDKLIEDPWDFLKKTHKEGEQGAEKYLTELRLISSRLSEEQKKMLREAPIFVGYRVPTPPNTDPFRLLPASNILIADDLENRQIFEKDAYLAPQDETLEKFYESMGSEYLGNHIKYNVIPKEPSMESNEITWPEDVRKEILRKLPIFLYGVDKQRLNNPSMHIYWEHRFRFVVRGCKDLKVEKRLDFQYWMSPQQPGFKYVRPVSAESTTEANSPLINLWHTEVNRADQVDMYDVAAALCRLLFKTHKKHDVFNLMAILETNMDILKQQGHEVDKIRADHAVAVSEVKIPEVQPAHPKSHNERFPFKLPSFEMWNRGGSVATGTVDVSNIEKSIVDVLQQLKEGGLPPQPSKIRNRGYGGAGKKLKNVEYCAVLEQTDLVLVPVGADVGSIKLWRHRTAQEEIPHDLLAEFTQIIVDLRGVFGLKDAKDTFNIFWHPKDRKLMGFNRRRLIFLNLAHYTSKRTEFEPGKACMEWYQIIVHEIAHHETPFHDERHELLASALSSRFLRSLHEVKDVRDYYSGGERQAQCRGSGDNGNVSEASISSSS